MISLGDVVQVVLDVVHVTDPDGTHYERVLVQGVFPQGTALPESAPGVSRNAVQVFLGHDMRSVSAFKIETGLARE